MTEPGEYRVLAALKDVCRAEGVALDVRADTHFMASRGSFARWAGTRRQLRMEFFYRDLRRQTGILMDGAKPEGRRVELRHPQPDGLRQERAGPHTGSAHLRGPTR